MSTDQNHLDTEQLTAAAAGGQLPSEGAAHVASCPSCREELRWWRTIAEATRMWAAADDLEPERVLASVQAEVDKRSRPADEVLAGGSQTPRSALTPDQVTGQSPSRMSRPRWRRPGLRTGVVSLAAAVVVAVAVSVVLVTGSSPPSSAQVRQKIAAASALSFKAGTILDEQTTRQKGMPVLRAHWVVLPASNVSRLSYFNANNSYYVTEVDNASTGYVRMTSSPTVPIATRGWASYPLGTITNPAQVPLGPLGRAAGVVGPITHLGTKTIGGVKATGYGVTVSVRALIAEAKTEKARDIYRSDFLEQGITSFRARIWLDSSGRVRELYWTVHPRYLPTRTNTELFSYSRTVATISFPPAGDVTPVANQAAAYTTALDDALAGQTG